MKAMKSVAVFGAVGVLILGLASPATAARKTVRDPRGDARPGLDITKVKFRHTSQAAFAKIFVRDLHRRGLFSFSLTNGRGDPSFGMVVTGRINRPPKKQFYKVRNGHFSWKRCRAAKVTWRPDRDFVRLKFPVRCYRALPRRVVMSVNSLAGFPDAPYVDRGPTVRLRR